MTLDLDDELRGILDASDDREKKAQEFSEMAVEYLNGPLRRYLDTVPRAPEGADEATRRGAVYAISAPIFAHVVDALIEIGHLAEEVNAPVDAVAHLVAACTATKDAVAELLAYWQAAYD